MSWWRKLFGDSASGAKRPSRGQTGGTAADDSREQKYPLHASARNGDFAAVKRLLASGLEVETIGPNGRTALHEAARHGDIEMARYLLDNGANIHALSSDGETPLHMAVSPDWIDHPNQDLVDLLSVRSLRNWGVQVSAQSLSVGSSNQSKLLSSLVQSRYHRVSG